MTRTSSRWRHDPRSGWPVRRDPDGRPAETGFARRQPWHPRAGPSAWHRSSCRNAATNPSPWISFGAWDADYVFTHAPGPFERARALNTGSQMASQPDILWCDGDLLFARDFPYRAQKEFRADGATISTPFRAWNTLPGPVSRGHQGERGLADCHAVRVRLPWGGGQPGATGLVRADFLHRHGGMIEGFLGWGAEDEAWVHKVSLLGRIGIHRQSGSAWLALPPSPYPAAVPRSWRDSMRSSAARNNNPFYGRNVDLLHRISNDQYGRGTFCRDNSRRRPIRRCHGRKRRRYRLRVCDRRPGCN